MHCCLRHSANCPFLNLLPAVYLQVLYCSGTDITIKALQAGPSSNTVTWKAHSSTVLKADWSPVTDLIVSGGEDCKYKVGGL